MNLLDSSGDSKVWYKEVIFVGSEVGLFFMENFDLIRSLFGYISILFLVVFFLNKIFFKSKAITSKFIAKTAVFSSLSILLYEVPVFKITLPFFPSFLELHFDEVPALIAAFAYGPISGFFVIVIKTIVKLPISTTACVGEFADLIYSIAFVVPASIAYKKIHKFKGALVGLIIGMVIQCITASVLTTFVMLDIYTKLIPGLTKESILYICQAINPNINDVGISFLLMFALPFNILKDAIVGISAIILYKKLHSAIDKIGAQKN